MVGQLNCKTTQGADECHRDQQTDQSSATYDLLEHVPQGKTRKTAPTVLLVLDPSSIQSPNSLQKLNKPSELKAISVFQQNGPIAAIRQMAPQSPHEALLIGGRAPYKLGSPQLLSYSIKSNASSASDTSLPPQIVATGLGTVP